MPPKASVDDNTVFLYHCIKYSEVRVDYGAIAAATGLTHGAVRMRFVRLREKIENLGTAATPTSGHAGPKDVPKPVKARVAAPAKRRFSQVHDDSSEDEVDDRRYSVAAPPPAHRRQTRGKVTDFRNMFEGRSSDVAPSRLAYADDVDPEPGMVDDEDDEDEEEEIVPRPVKKHKASKRFPSSASAFGGSIHLDPRNSHVGSAGDGRVNPFVDEHRRRVESPLQTEFMPLVQAPNSFSPASSTFNRGGQDADLAHFRSGMMMKSNNRGTIGRSDFDDYHTAATHFSRPLPPSSLAQFRNQPSTPVRQDFEPADSLAPDDSISVVAQGGLRAARPTNKHCTNNFSN